MEHNAAAHGLASQLLAGLDMLKDCIDRCPVAQWNEPHNDYPFSQVVFHTLSDCDYNLCASPEAWHAQDFHRHNRAFFPDHQSIEDQVLRNAYEREVIYRYYTHCRERVVEVVEPQTLADLTAPNADIDRNMTRFERYVNGIRHVQHHAAQLGLRLQGITGTEMEWISRGYEQ